MDMGHYIASKFGVDYEKDLDINKRNEIWNYYQKNGLAELGDNGNIVCQLLDNWLRGNIKND